MEHPHPGSVLPLALAGLLLASCGGAPSPGPGGSRAVPAPALDRLDPELRETLERERDGLAGAVSRGADDGADWGRLGMRYHAVGLDEAAADCYARAAALESGAPEWPYLLAQLLRATDPLRALEHAERAVGLRPDDVPALVLAGELSLAAGRPERARERLERALGLDPRCAPALVALGRLDLADREFALAAERLERALAIAPEADSIHYPLALAYRGLGDEPRAERHLALRGEVKVRTPDPLLDGMRALAAGGARLHQDRGTGAATAGRFAEAAEEFRRAVEARPDDAALRRQLAMASYLAGDVATARAELHEVLRLSPGDAEANLHLGVLAALDGDDAAALARLEQAVGSDPRLRLAQLNLAALLQRLGRHAEALPHYERTIAIDPANAAARLGRAVARARLGRWTAARDGLEEDIRVLPDQPAFPHALARVLACSGDERVRDPGRALALLQEVSERLRNTDVAESIAMALAGAGRFEQAASWQERAIESARGAGRADLAGRMAERLARYRRGEACREPWEDGDAVLRPPPISTFGESRGEPPPGG